MIFELLSIVFVVLGIVISLYMSAELRDRATKNPNSLMNAVFSKIDWFLFGNESDEVKIRYEVTGSSIEAEVNDFESYEIFSKGFDIESSMKKLKYREFDVKLNVLPGENTRSGFLLAFLAVVMIFVFSPLLLFYTFFPDLRSNEIVAIAMLIWFFSNILLLRYAMLSRKYVMQSLFQLLVHAEIVMYFRGNKLSIYNGRWIRLSKKTSSNVRFEIREKHNKYGLYLCHEKEDIEVAEPVVEIPLWLKKYIFSGQDIYELCKNLNILIQGMVYLEER